jgi:hypothetical protein
MPFLLRNNNMKYFFCLLFTGISALSLHAANYYADNNRDLFMLPRSSAMGTSDFVFSRDGSNQCNPANLSGDSLSELCLAYAGFYQNAFSASILSYSAPVTRHSGIGLSAAYLYNPDIPITEDLQTMSVGSDVVPVYDPSRITYTSGSEIYVHFGYGYKRAVLPGVTASAGVALNAVRHNLPPFRGYGIGCDGGIMFDFIKSGLRTGFGVENITTNYTRWSKDWGVTASPHVRFGLGWQRDIPYLYGKIQLQFKSLDLLGNEGINATIADSATDAFSNQISKPVKKKFTNDPGYFLLNGVYGVEYTVLQGLSLRAGIPVGGGYGDDWNRIAFGGGVNLLKKCLSIDISYLSSELAGTYQLGVTYRWQNDMINSNNR